MDIVLCILAPAPKQPVCRCYRLIYMEHCMSPEASTAESARFLRNASRSNSPGRIGPKQLTDPRVSTSRQPPPDLRKPKRTARSHPAG